MRTITKLAIVLMVAGTSFAAVRSLSNATLSTHHRVAPDSRIELVLEAHSKGAEAGQTLTEMVEAQVLTCRLEVSSDVMGEIEEVSEGRFRSVLAPSMDESNRRQFRGCLEDWVIDQVRLDVIRLAPI